MRRLLPISLLLAGCAGEIPETKRYLLRTESRNHPEEQKTRSKVVLGTLSIAPYIDRLGLVVEAEDGTVRSARYHIWAEPLGQSLRVFLANEVAKADPEADLLVRPVQFMFPNAGATTLTDGSYWKLTKVLGDALGLRGADLQEQMRGIARRRFRRRIAGFAQFRKGVEGYSRDLDRVMRAHIGEVTRYVWLDKLKYRAINDMEAIAGR